MAGRSHEWPAIYFPDNNHREICINNLIWQQFREYSYGDLEFRQRRQ